MAEIKEELKEKLQDLYRENLIVLGDVNEIEKTLSRIKNEANELADKLTELIGDKSGSNET